MPVTGASSTRLLQAARQQHQLQCAHAMTAASALQRPGWASKSRPQQSSTQRASVLLRARRRVLDELREIDEERTSQSRPEKGSRLTATEPDWARPAGSCPCCSGRPLKECCARFVMGDTWPETAEQLMRSRFTAYVLKQPDWLKASAHSSCPALQGTWRDGVQVTTFEQDCEATFKAISWFRLRIADASPGATDDEAFVEFTAWLKTADAQRGRSSVAAQPMESFTESFTESSTESFTESFKESSTESFTESSTESFTELSRFVREGGRWLYADAVQATHGKLPYD